MSYASSNTLQTLEKSIERATGRVIDEIRETPLCAIPRQPNPTYEGLNPKNLRDARTIANLHATLNRYGLGNSDDSLPHEVIDAQLTLALIE